MKVSELGEFGLIERLAGQLASPSTAGVAGRLVVGLGDDAAVWQSDGGALIATTDTLVAGVHFLPERTPWRDLGWKALAVNVSDVAAMGGTPSLALVTLALPPDVEVEQVDELYRGLAEACEAYGVVIAGGDVVRSPTVIVSVTLLGQAEVNTAGEPVVMRRDAAQAGDLVVVTGSLGGAAGGLRSLREGAEDTEAARSLIERHLRPQPRLQVGRAAIAAGVRCAVDISDGLLQDLGHICRMSRLAAVLKRGKLPIDPGLTELFEPEEALRCAVAGGEDYELLLVGTREEIDEVERTADVPVTVIGEMVAETEHRVRLLDESGQEVPTPAAGWDHLRGQG